MQYDEFDVLTIIDLTRVGPGSPGNLTCPVCQFDHTHVGRGDPHNAYPWTDIEIHEISDENFNNDVVLVPVWSECGCEWALCIGQHKGQATLFARVLISCIKD